MIIKWIQAIKDYYKRKDHEETQERIKRFMEEQKKYREEQEKMGFIKPKIPVYKIEVVTSEQAVSEFLEENKEIGLVDIKMTDNRFMIIYRVLEEIDD